ncbi:MAG: trehalase family glycosidase [Bacteroidia bacterium]
MKGQADNSIHSKDYTECIKYIEKYWKQITYHHPHDQFKHLGLPKKFVSPNDGIYKNDQFYWDSYFIILGLVVCGRTELAKGMVDNFLFMQKRFNIIPMRNRFYNIGSSQTPFLTSMAKEVYYETDDKNWFRHVMKAAEHELSNYWMNKSLTEIHIVFEGLSRYCDHYITHLAAEHESGWDMTSRFHNHCLDYLPVDLNCALYKYETDLAEFYKLSRNGKKSNHYILQSEKRRKKMNDLMWNFKKGFYFDYDYKHKKQSAFYSVAGFYPLWAKLATYTQAKKIAENLNKFEFKGGIANTQASGLSEEYKQHDYPNGWPHQQWIVIKGLINYGFKEDAIRITKKYLDLNKKVFMKTGKLWEKYDVVNYDIGKSERYPTQSGFGWTNAVFIRLLKKFAPSS